MVGNQIPTHYELYQGAFRSAQVLSASAPHPSFLPEYKYKFNEYLLFDFNYATIFVVLYEAYYLILEPVAAVRVLIYREELSLTYSLSCFTHRNSLCLC